MAEGVERAMVNMSMELRYMKDSSLFSDSELRTIREKREKFEYKLRGIPKNIEDFKSYIRFENDLLALAKYRREKMKISEKKNGFEQRIRQRIKQLYEEILLYFSHDYDTSVEFLMFCKSTKVNGSSAISSLIEHNSRNENSWHLAAMWHENNHSIALEYLVKGLAIHKNSKLLYKDAIQLELSQTENNIKQEDKVKIGCLKIHDYLTAVFANITDVTYYLELLTMMDQYSFALSLSSLLVDKILALFSDEPVVWNGLAQREFKNATGGKKATDTGLHEACVKKYLEGIEKIRDAGKKSALWSMFLDHILHLYSLKKCDSDFISHYMERAHDEGCLAERYYDSWLELNRDEMALDILMKGTQAFPASVKLWRLLFHYKILKQSNPDEVEETFNRGVQECREKALPLWSGYIRYNMLQNVQKAVELFEKGVQEPPAISDVLKPQYIEWLVIKKGIVETRKVYKKLSTQEPYCKKLHLSMANIEMTERHLENVEKVWKLACKQFSTDVDVWVHYMEYARHCVLNRHSKTIIVYSEAVKHLKDLQLSHFREKYSGVLAIVTLN